MKNKQKEFHPLDLPEAYNDLGQVEKEALAYWINHAMCNAARYSQRTSYGIKHDFEREGFYITNGQFKGAMLAAGYQPEDASELNWMFKVKPCKDASLPLDDPAKFRIGKDQPNHQSYYEILARVDAEYRRKAAERQKEEAEAREY